MSLDPISFRRRGRRAAFVVRARCGVDLDTLRHALALCAGWGVTAHLMPYSISHPRTASNTASRGLMGVAGKPAGILGRAQKSGELFVA
jgi:hypothetical protein